LLVMRLDKLEDDKLLLGSRGNFLLLPQATIF
jgi:hypothetical protein